MIRASMWALAAVMGVPVTVAAQDGATPDADKQAEAISLLDKKAKQEGSFTFDYGVPTSPALTLTGVSPDKLNTSSSLKPFVLSLPDVFSADGARTVAFDASPAQLILKPRQQHYSEYVNADTAYRILFRTRLGLVIDRGEEGGEDPKKGAASKLGVGVSTSLLDHSDPLMTTDQRGQRVWETCVARHLGELPDSRSQTPAQQQRTQLELAQHLIDALRLGAAPVGTRRSTPGILADIEQIEAILSRVRADAAPRQPAPSDASLRALEAEASQLSGPAKQEVLQAIALIKSRLTTAASTPTAVDAPNYDSAEFDTWLASARSEVAAAIETLPTETAVEDAKEYEVRTEELKACAVQASEHAQAAQDLDVGAGAVWSGEKGKVEGFDDPSRVVWAAYRFPLRALFGRGALPAMSDADEQPLQHWVVGGSARIAWSEQLATGDEDNPEIEADVAEAWVGLERLTSSSRFAAQYGWFDGKATEAEHAALSRTGERWLLSGAYRLSSADTGMWLSFSYGAFESSLEGFDDKVALVSVTFSPPTLSTMFTGP